MSQHTRPWRVTLAFCAALALPSVAFAQQTGADPAARAAFERGMSALANHQYQDAAREFETSYQLRPLPVVLYNLALAHRELGHTSASIAHFERYLNEGGTTLPAERVTAVREVLAALRVQLAAVALTVTPATFALSVDGRDATAAGGAVTLDPGVHVLVITAAGHEPWREELRLTSGERVTRAVTLTPVAAPPTPTVTAAPAVTAAPVTTPHPRRTRRATPITARWWFWTGLAVLVVGAVVTGAVVASANATPEPLVSGTRFNVGTILGE